MSAYQWIHLSMAVVAAVSWILAAVEVDRAKAADTPWGKADAGRWRTLCVAFAVCFATNAFIVAVAGE